MVVGVHSPEFGYEKRRLLLEAEIRRHGLRYPQYLDINLAYWRALDNHYWPTTYVIDRCGMIRKVHIGEIHAGKASGDEMDAAIEALLAESPACPAS